MNLLIKFPTRGRPDLFFRTLARYRGLLSGEHPARVVVSCDEDDPAMTTFEVRDRLAGMEGVEVFYNPPPQTKVTAINANVPADGWDLLILASDDMIPERQGYDARLADLFVTHFPDGDGVLHTDDGRVGRKLNTQVVCDRKWYARFGYLYHHAYAGLWCDNELTEVSNALGRAAYVDEVILRHRWTDVTGQDELHRRNESHYESDARTYQARKDAGFPR